MIHHLVDMKSNACSISALHTAAEIFLVTWCDSSHYTFPLRSATAGFICHRSKSNGIWILMVASLQFLKSGNPGGNQRYTSCNFIAGSKDHDSPHWPKETPGRRRFGDRSYTGNKVIFFVQTQPTFGEGGCWWVFFGNFDTNMPQCKYCYRISYRLFHTLTDMLSFHLFLLIFHFFLFLGMWVHLVNIKTLHVCAEVFVASVNKLQTTAQYFSFAVFFIITLPPLPVSVQTSEDTVFPEKRCKGSRKALFKDLDGGVLDLEPPVSVFPKSEFEWTQFYLQAGKYLCYLECLQSHACIWPVKCGFTPGFHWDLQLRSRRWWSQVVWCLCRVDVVNYSVEVWEASLHSSVSTSASLPSCRIMSPGILSPFGV